MPLLILRWSGSRACCGRQCRGSARQSCVTGRAQWTPCGGRGRPALQDRSRAPTRRTHTKHMLCWPLRAVTGVKGRTSVLHSRPLCSAWHVQRAPGVKRCRHTQPSCMQCLCRACAQLWQGAHPGSSSPRPCRRRSHAGVRPWLQGPPSCPTARASTYGRPAGAPCSARPGARPYLPAPAPAAQVPQVRAGSEHAPSWTYIRCTQRESGKRSPRAAQAPVQMLTGGCAGASGVGCCRVCC